MDGRVTGITSARQPGRTPAFLRPVNACRSLGAPGEDGRLAVLWLAAAAFLGATWVALLQLGMKPVFPWPLLLALFIVILPSAFILGATLFAVERACGDTRVEHLVVALVMLIMPAGWQLVVFVARDPRIGLTIDVALVVGCVFMPPIRRALLAAVTLVVFFAGIWHANYAGLWISRDRLLDPVGRLTDVWVYGLAGLDVSSYTAVFPLVSRRLVTVLEHGYMFLLPELMALIFLVAHEEADRTLLRRLVVAVGACYLAGVLIYLVVPMSGPCLYYPQSIGPSLTGTTTQHGMRQSLAEFESVRRTGAAVTGFAYFVALPSLHAALATLVQLVAFRKPSRGWMVLPVNVCAILATFLLGWHYVIDVPFGILLGAVAYLVVVRPKDAARLSAATGYA